MLNLRHSRLAILGVVRNSEKYLSHTIKKLVEATSGFREVEFFVVESDSIDKTNEVLARLKRNGLPVLHVSLGNLAARYPERTQRIAYCRNYAKFELLNAYLGEKYDFVMVADLDGVNRQISRTAVESCWNVLGWDVATANQPNGYYDIYALRHPEWSPNDCWIQKHHLTPVVGEDNALKISVVSRMIKIPIEEKAIKVDSAFGGAAIYSKEAYSDVKYEGLLESGESVCEHVPPNLKISNSGGSILIVPSFVNIKSLAYSHRIGSYKWLRLLKEENRGKFH